MKKDFLRAALEHAPAVKHAAVNLKNMASARQYVKEYGNAYGVNDKLVLFQAYSGRQFACSPKELYLAMRQSPKYRDFSFVWAFNEPEKFEFLLEDGRTSLVKYGSVDYLRSLACAKYWISNTRIPSGVVKKENQVYVQTWHGTPFKKLGFDVEKYITGADDIYSLRQSYESDAKRFDYLLSPSPFYTEHMTSAFHLQALGREDLVLEQGYPRNDPLYLAKEEDRILIRKKLGIPEGKKLILYAPTWREENLKPSKGFTYSSGIDFTLGMNFKKFQEALGEDYVVLLRTHYFVSKAINFAEYGPGLVDVSTYPDINELYIAADLLLTDYSSVFFDYAILKKPMVFYMYDLEKYRDVRDFYFSTDLLPGLIIENEVDLPGAIKHSLKNPCFDEKYENFLKMFHPMEGPCSERVLDEIIET